MNVGLIGLGNMGSGMAACLIKGGHAVTVYNRTPAKRKRLSRREPASRKVWPTPAKATR